MANNELYGALGGNNSQPTASEGAANQFLGMDSNKWAVLLGQLAGAIGPNTMGARLGAVGAEQGQQNIKDQQARTIAAKEQDRTKMLASLADSLTGDGVKTKGISFGPDGSVKISGEIASPAQAAEGSADASASPQQATQQSTQTSQPRQGFSELLSALSGQSYAGLTPEQATQMAGKDQQMMMSLLTLVQSQKAEERKTLKDTLTQLNEQRRLDVTEQRADTADKRAELADKRAELQNTIAQSNLDLNSKKLEQQIKDSEARRQADQQKIDLEARRVAAAEKKAGGGSGALGAKDRAKIRMDTIKMLSSPQNMINKYPTLVDGKTKMVSFGNLPAAERKAVIEKTVADALGETTGAERTTQPAGDDAFLQSILGDYKKSKGQATDSGDILEPRPLGM